MKKTYYELEKEYCYLLARNNKKGKDVTKQELNEKKRAYKRMNLAADKPEFSQKRLRKIGAIKPSIEQTPSGKTYTIPITLPGKK